ncbi:hypothetical protein [Streptomyces rubiginosohelvolus]
MSENISIKHLNGYGTTLAAVINLPEGFDASKSYPAIVVSHSGGGVKEQAAGLGSRRCPAPIMRGSMTADAKGRPAMAVWTPDELERINAEPYFTVEATLPDGTTPKTVDIWSVHLVRARRGPDLHPLLQRHAG